MECVGDIEMAASRIAVESDEEDVAKLTRHHDKAGVA